MTTINNWTFKGNVAWHVPCDSPAYSYYINTGITCEQCKEPLPKELEFPAAVYKSHLEIPSFIFNSSSNFYITAHPKNWATISFRLNSNRGYRKVK